MLPGCLWEELGVSCSDGQRSDANGVSPPPIHRQLEGKTGVRSAGLHSAAPTASERRRQPDLVVSLASFAP